MSPVDDINEISLPKRVDPQPVVEERPAPLPVSETGGVKPEPIDDFGEQGLEEASVPPLQEAVEEDVPAREEEPRAFGEHILQTQMENLPSQMTNI